MIAWVMKHIVWFIIRIAVTLVCMVTVKNVAHTQGYFISYEVLLVSAVCLIVGVRMWMPSYKDKESNKDTTWGG